MITYKTMPTGGLGNRLFQYHFLLQVGNQLGARTLIPWGKDSQFVTKNTSHLSHRIDTFTDSKAAFSSKDFGDPLSVELIEKIQELTSLKSSVSLVPPFLGEWFFQSCFRNPKTLFKPQPRLDVGQPFIALHIRGGDFAAWNPDAILPADYYISAIEQSLTQEGNLPVVIVTDDTSQSAIELIRQAYPQQTTMGEQVRRDLKQLSSFHGDFALLGAAKTLISSPSTFAIWASILGENASVIHSKSWVESMAARGDVFWLKLLAGGNAFYHASELI